MSSRSGTSRPQGVFSIEPNTDPTYVKPDKIRGMVVDRVQLYTQENDSGNLPYLPDTDNLLGLNLRSTGHIFALLSLVEECAIVPGQRTGSDTIIV